MAKAHPTRKLYPVEHSAWSNMRQRCENKNHQNYKRYGARGIGVSDEWSSFAIFFRDMGPRPDGYTLERVNNHLGYSKGNCTWATRREQARNTRKNVLVTFNGKTQCISQWAEDIGIDSNTLRSRLRSGWSVCKALTTPTANTFPTRIIAHDGETLTIAQWSSKTGIEYGTIKERLNMGWSVERTLSTPVTVRTLTYDGRTATIAEWSEISGIAHKALISRVNLGWSAEKALTTPVAIGRTLSHDGKTETLKEWAEICGMSPQTIRSRLNRGWSVERALTTPCGHTT